MIPWPWLVVAFYAGALAAVLTLGMCRAAAHGDAIGRASGDSGTA